MEPLLFQRDGHVATITLNRPDVMNAFSPAVHEGLINALDEYEADRTVRAVIITGAGTAFSAGGDLKAMKERMENTVPPVQNRDRYMAQSAKTVTRIAQFEKPLIAAVNGAAAGAGCSLAMLCDIRIASSKAKFGLVFVKRGLVPDWAATYVLPRLVGAAKAADLLLTGRVIRADEALKMGLVGEVVEPEQLMERAQAVAQEIASNAPIAIRFVKRMLHQSVMGGLGDMLAFEGFAQSVASSTMDHREAVKAFLDKREANFTGE